jgi:hypothetical protein
MGKFKYIIFSDNTYQVTVDDWSGEPYTFEVTGQEIADSFRREKLLDRAFDELYNVDKENHDRQI